MTFSSAKPLACALATITLLAALPAETGVRLPARGHHDGHSALVERSVDAGKPMGTGIIDLAAGAFIAGIVNQPQPPAYREPAWRHPQAYPRPSPDRNYFPPAPPHRPGPTDRQETTEAQGEFE